MYLIDTNVISEARKGEKANAGVRAFFQGTHTDGHRLFLSAVTVGELSRGVELIRRRGDADQAQHLARWLDTVLRDYASQIPSLDADVAQAWGKLRAPYHENVLDKQIAATALVYDLPLVTRNSNAFAATGVRLLNPFEGNPPDSPVTP